MPWKAKEKFHYSHENGFCNRNLRSAIENEGEC